MVVAMTAGLWGLHAHPFPADDPFLAMIALANPFVFHVLGYGYAALWFSTPFFAASFFTSVVAIVIFRAAYYGLPMLASLIVAPRRLQG